MTHALGGPADFLDRFMQHLPEAPVIMDVEPVGEGFVSAIDTRAIGQSVVDLGGGRAVPSDVIRHDVGFDRLLGLGNRADRHTPLARVHAGDLNAAEAAASAVRAAFTLSDVPPEETPLILERIS